MEQLVVLKDKRLKKLMDRFIGNIFGKLTILEILGAKKGRTFVKAKCECGTIKEFYLYNLLRNSTRSCGCLTGHHSQPHPIKHGEARPGKVALEYLSYIRMRQNLKKNISICSRWLEKPMGYQNFLEDMGRKPINSEK